MTLAEFAAFTAAIAIPASLVGVGAAFARLGSHSPPASVPSWIDDEPVRMLVNAPEELEVANCDLKPEPPDATAQRHTASGVDATSPDAPPARFDAAAGARWLQQCRAIAERIHAEKGEITTDDIWDECPAPAGVDGRLLAGCFPRREWEVVGYRHSSRGRNSARQIAVWRRKGAVAA